MFENSYYSDARKAYASPAYSPYSKYMPDTATNISQPDTVQDTMDTPHAQQQFKSQQYTPYTLYRQGRQGFMPGQYNTAYAIIVPGPDYPSIRGIVTFADIRGGSVMVCADIAGLPPYRPASGNNQPIGPFGFHIHEKGDCAAGDPSKPFTAAGEHWNPANQPHGNHAGDFPVLVADNGRARMCFIIDRFTVDEILGRSVMVHENPDDYRTQPAGNAGKRIACGVIKPWNAFQQVH